MLFLSEITLQRKELLLTEEEEEETKPGQDMTGGKLAGWLSKERTSFMLSCSGADEKGCGTGSCCSAGPRE